MSSLGYVMMNWTSELIKSSKKRKRKELKLKKQEEVNCANCPHKLDQIDCLERDLEQLKRMYSETCDKLEQSKKTLIMAKEREGQLKDANERAVLEEAQVRYDFNQFKKDTEERWQQNAVEHDKQLKSMEQILIDKERQWAEQNNALQHDLGYALHQSWENSNIESMSRAQLEQELFSLRAVLEMRQCELQNMRQANQDLEKKLEKFNWMELELGKARQRLEEMNLVVQNKMIGEKEMLDMTEGLTNDLASARNEIIGLRRELENKHYLQNQLVCRRSSQREESAQFSNSEANGCKNQHQKASYGKKEPTLVLELVEKSDSLAWMLHLPDSPKLGKI